MGYLRYGMGLPIGVRVTNICDVKETLERVREREGIELQWDTKLRPTRMDSNKLTEQHIERSTMIDRDQLRRPLRNIA